MNEKEDRRFYVYAFLREQSSCNGKKGSPYYIGKGTGHRAWMKSKRRVRPPVCKQNIVLLRSNLTEFEAFNWEQLYISHYGRIDKNTGILRNCSDGGEGEAGRITSEAHKQILRQARQREGRWKGSLNPKAGGDAVRGEKNPMYGKKHKENTKRLISEANKRVYSDPAKRIQNKLKAQKYLYELIDPCGEVYITDNLYDFSMQYGLTNACLNKAVRGKAAHHKGWTGKIVETLR